MQRSCAGIPFTPRAAKMGKIFFGANDAPGRTHSFRVQMRPMYHTYCPVCHLLIALRKEINTFCLSPCVCVCAVSKWGKLLQVVNQPTNKYTPKEAINKRLLGTNCSLGPCSGCPRLRVHKGAGRRRCAGRSPLLLAFGFWGGEKNNAIITILVCSLRSTATPSLPLRESVFT